MRKYRAVEELEERLEQEKRSYLRDRGWECTSQTPGCLWLWRRDFADVDARRAARHPSTASPFVPYGVIAGATTDVALHMTRSELERRKEDWITVSASAMPNLHAVLNAIAERHDCGGFSDYAVPQRFLRLLPVAEQSLGHAGDLAALSEPDSDEAEALLDSMPEGGRVWELLTGFDADWEDEE